MLAFTRAIGLLLVATGIILSCLQNESLAAEDNVFAGIAAEYHYRAKYKNLEGYKAFAIGPYGSFGYAWGRQSAREARDYAFKSCRGRAAWWQEKYGVTGECRLLAENDNLLVSNPWIGPAWQKPATGLDIPLMKGRSSKYTGLKLKGIVLLVHGCNGLGGRTYFEVWDAYFTALGFSSFAPDSFAEPRPAEICGLVTPDRARDQDLIMKLRIAQTQRTIAGLKKDNPGLPIYVWGHSEGSVIVKYLEAEVAGIILSGDGCDAAGLGIAAPASVPVLFMFGDNDPYAAGFNLPLTDDSVRKCRKYTKSENTKSVVVKNNEHIYWPWRPEIAKAVSQFIGAKSSGLPELLPAKIFNLSDRQKAAKANYSKSQDHRAFVASERGAFAWADKWPFAEDAAQYALYRCHLVEKLNVFALPKAKCFILDVDGKDLTTP